MLLPVYSQSRLSIDRGEGCYVWDDSGRRYLDFITGIGVNALGHAHPRILRAIAEQSRRCIHTSNLHQHAWQKPLARRLADWSGLPYAFFANSGSEAMEVALKAARAHGVRISPRKYHVVALEGSFHGRTLGALSVTGQPHYREPFGPLLPGVAFVRANDVAGLRTAVTDQTAAIVLEVIQGEGGVRPLDEAFLREARRLADGCGALWIADETQCGLGRTGHRFAYQGFPGLLPDIVVTAKPLAAGMPLSAALFSEKAASAMGKGSHGTTFGGGPLACRVALEVLDLIDELLPNIRRTGAYLRKRLDRVFRGAAVVRGAGMMLGVDRGTPADWIVAEAQERGLLVNGTAHTVLRLLPPFITTEAQVDEAIETLALILETEAQRSPYRAPVVEGVGDESESRTGEFRSGLGELRRVEKVDRLGAEDELPVAASWNLLSVPTGRSSLLGGLDPKATAIRFANPRTGIRTSSRERRPE